MAADDKPLFLQPIELLDADKTIEISSTNRDLPTGTYANVFSLAYSIAQLITTHETGTTTVAIVASTIAGQGGSSSNTQEGLFVSFTLAGSGISVEWTTSFLPTLLGFMEDKASPGTVYEAVYPIGKAWQPTYQRLDQGRFWLDQRSVYTGTTAKGGQLAGCRTGPNIYKRTMNFQHDLAQNTCAEGSWDNTHSDFESPSWGDNTYNYMQERHLERFVTDCRTSAPIEAGNLPTNGFYYIQDSNKYTTTLTTALMTFGSGGVKYDLKARPGVAPDYYTFCQLESRGSREPRISVPTGLGYYNHKLKFNTCEVPGTWQLYTA